MAFTVPFLALWRFFSVNQKHHCQIRAKMCVCRLWNWFYGIRRCFFSTLAVILRLLKVLLPKYGWKRVFAGFETGFTAFAVIFLALWRFFCVDLRYHSHIQAKPSVCRLWNRFYSFRCSFFSTLEVFLHRSKVLLHRYGQKRVRWNEISFCGIHCSFFSTLNVFCIYRRYCCQDTGKKVCLQPFKPVLRHSPFFFDHFGWFIASIGGTFDNAINLFLPALKLV